MPEYPLSGAARSENARTRRLASVELSFDGGAGRVHQAADNGDNDAYTTRPMAYSKGLEHDGRGFLKAGAFEALEQALTRPGTDQEVDPAFDVPVAHVFDPDGSKVRTTVGGSKVGYRKLESPLAGMYYENEGPDPDGVGMAPAPKLGESELCAEMVEVYAMALVRDMTFSQLSEPSSLLTHVDPSVEGGQTLTFDNAGKPATVQDLIDGLNALAWFGKGGPVSSLGGGPLGPDLTGHEQRRRAARFDTEDTTGTRVTAETLFRGSSPGCKTGPYISQFLLAASTNGRVGFGAQEISLFVKPMRAGVDHMTNWAAWRVVQNGEKLSGLDECDPTRRPITTPRDLAAYVHIDQLYQAYFCACLMLLNAGVPGQKGFPNAGRDTREGFATFGGPHVLSLMTEVATRSLRAVRRQKFQIHRRARPERLAAMLTLAAHEPVALGNAADKFTSMLTEMGVIGGGNPDTRRILDWIAARNALLNACADDRVYQVAPDPEDFAPSDAGNFLLPMAFPEGSPMHPAYGAGHATVAGACTTVLKAFFDLYDEDGDQLIPRLDSASPGGRVFTAVGQGQFGNCSPFCIFSDPPDMTVEGELNKLAANIAIGRNFAGVHYYTDYYDSLRLGERVAVGILQEQMTAYPECVKMSFRDFDGHRIDLETDGSGTAPGVTMSVDNSDAPEDVAAWWVQTLAEFPERP